MLNTYNAFAVIDIGKLRNNVKTVCKLSNGSMVYAVVKADAYSHGIELASYIEKQVDGFAVATVDEGVKLRFMGIVKPIMVLLPFTQNQLLMASNFDLSVACYSTESAKMLADFSSTKQITVNMKVDSGMNRLGFLNIKSFFDALKLLSAKHNIRINSLYSHFLNSQSSNDCQKQTEIFLDYQKLFDDYSDGFKHISASGGLLQKQFNFDAVRVGILLYGYKPFECDVDVSPIMKVVAPSIKKQKFTDGEKCLYNVSVVSGEYSLVSAGYADGLFRNNAVTRCMNISYVSEMDGDNALIMDDAEKLAKENNTISYEVLVRLSSNLRKKYIGFL